MKNLTYRVKSNDAKFRAVIYPHKEGHPVPEISGQDGLYTISIGNQVDRLETSNQPETATKVKIARK